jgi:hypothetical protein
MNSRSRQRIYAGRIIGAQMRADRAREAARRAIREADRAEAEAWSIAQCLNGGLSFLEVECNRCNTRASLPLDAIRRPRDTPLWKLEASLKCRSCRNGRYAPPVRMIRLSETREISPYLWVHPDEEDR